MCDVRSRILRRAGAPRHRVSAMLELILIMFMYSCCTLQLYSCVRVYMYMYMYMYMSCHVMHRCHHCDVEEDTCDASPITPDYPRCRDILFDICLDFGRSNVEDIVVTFAPGISLEIWE